MANDERREAAETELRVAADSMLDGFGILSPVRDDAGEISDFRYRYVNDAYCAFVGFDRGLLLGHRVGELFPQFLAGERFELYRRVALTGEPFRTDEVQLPSTWDSTALASRVFDTVIASMGEDLVLSVRDITERKRAQEQLVQTAGLLERTQEISKTGGWEYDVAAARLTWTDEVYRICGIERTSDPPEVVTTIAAYDQESAPIISAAFERLVAEGEPYDFELGLVRGDGQRIWVRTIGRPVFEGGRVVRVNGAIADITERKEAEQELQLRAELLDLAHDAMIVRDPVESRVTFWNREAETIYGYDRAEAVGRVTHELLGTVFPESKEAVDVALAQHGRWEGELHHTRKDGTVIAVSSRQALARDEHGQPVAIIALNSDVTEQKRSEADLAYMSGLLERTQVISKTGGWEYDLATRKLTRTGEVYRIFGDERTDLPIELDEAIAGYGPERAPIIGSAFQRLVTEGEPYDLEVDMVRADGKQIWVRVIGQPVLEDGRIVRVGGIVADVTDRRQAEEEIRTLNAELEQRVAARTAELERANRELETFAYSVSHDLRAPLRAVNAFSQLLREDCGEKVGAEGRHYLERVHAGAVRMGELIDAVLELSRLSRRPMMPVQVDLSALAGEIVAELQSADADRGIEVEIEGGLLAEADLALVRSVLQNLLANAYKFTSRTPHARVHFGTVDNYGVPVYFVADNGAGFDMAHAKELFLPFYRLHQDSEFRAKGSAWRRSCEPFTGTAGWSGRTAP
jgi:PAS domain S-box-containing protein